MLAVERQISGLVLGIHRRNGGKLDELDWNWRLLEPALGIDSLDLAEIVVGIEKQFQVALFELPEPPRTWKDVRRAVANGSGLGRDAMV